MTILALVLIGVGSWWFIVVDNIADEVIIEAGSMPLASDFLIRDLDIPAEFESDLEEYDLTRPGLYDVTLRYNGRSYTASLRVRDTVAPTGQTQALTVFATQRPEPEDFLQEVRDVTGVTAAYETEPDMTRDGAQTVVILLTDEGGNTTRLEASLTVIHDDTPPSIQGVRELRYYLDQEIDYLEGVTVLDDLDPETTLTVDDSQVDLTVPGVYDLAYIAKDASGNQTALVTTVTVIEDRTPPEILGAFDRTLCVGSTIAYRSGVVVRDDIDEAPVLTVDSSQVDLSRPGSYPVIYHAVDEAGNEATREITVTVHEKVYYFVEEDVIHQEADRILAGLIDEDMTVEEQVRAIYHWAQNSFFYVGDSDKTDWKQSAYQMIRTGKGDCYSFFAISKLMFERLGIPNIDVKRLRTAEHSADHYWSMVSTDGGETWYHYDSTPFVTVPERFCLVTDAYLDAFSADHWNYYNRDRDALPATPAE